ncbi:MAG: sigma-54 dependent transcriptional regulator [Desulfobacteraceae bacterium]|jgi:two-component system response regulator FlrC
MHHRPALIVHPDNHFCESIERILSDLKCRVEIESVGAVDSSRIRLSDYCLFVVDEKIECTDGRRLQEVLLKNAHDSPVIIIADQADVHRAVSAIKNGAFEYFTQKSEIPLIKEGLTRAWDLCGPNKHAICTESKTSKVTSIITCSNNMKHLLKIAMRVAVSNATVLIQGESGTGKELIARLIHRQSDRSKQPFVAMNCAALPETLAESELFGYEKGAFTGASHNRAGKFVQAQGGTLMLDEISEMPLNLQVKLLRVLQEKEVDPVGGRKTIPVDVRVIATSNRDLAQMVKDGTFREDLYFRLRVIPLTIPPLRERKEDIPLLVQHFAEKFKTVHQSENIQFGDSAVDQLSNWPWPGNVRELENTIERAMLICDEELIEPIHLLLDYDISPDNDDDKSALVGMTVKEMEKKLIGQTLKHVNDNRTHAAKMLGISIRTLRNKLREYGNANVPAINAAQE